MMRKLKGSGNGAHLGSPEGPAKSCAQARRSCRDVFGEGALEGGGLLKHPALAAWLLCYSSFSASSAGSFFARCGSVTAKIDATMSTHPTPCIIVSVSPNMR